MAQGFSGQVSSVHLSARHEFSKEPVGRIVLLAGLGVEGDCPAGTTVQHLSRVARDPSQPNLRQVHLIQTELFDRLATAGRPVQPGELGENVATRGLDLLTMPTGTVLRLGPSAVVQLTGLRIHAGRSRRSRAGCWPRCCTTLAVRCRARPG